MKIKDIRIFSKMIKEEKGNGIDESEVKKEINLPTYAIEEGPAVKSFHILAYDIQNKRFQFHSRSMYSATKQYLKEISENKST